MTFFYFFLDTLTTKKTAISWSKLKNFSSEVKTCCRRCSSIQTQDTNQKKRESK